MDPSRDESDPKPKAAKGVVLDKDGKPCKTCTSVRDLFAQQRRSAAAATNPSSSTATSTATATGTANLPPAHPPTAAALPDYPEDCPADVERLGRHTWTLLHTLTATYPERPTASDRANARGFMTAFSKIYPCSVCREDFQEWMGEQEKQGEVEKALGGREMFGRFMCGAHNVVNVKLGKGVFDCGRWRERWVDGEVGCP